MRQQAVDAFNSSANSTQELISAIIVAVTMTLLVKQESPSPGGASSTTNNAASSVPASTSSTATPADTPAALPASDDYQAQKRARRSKPKVKTGCINCKQRRIKCDEKRPACTQCVRASKVCTGYPPPSRSSRPFEELRIAPKPIPLRQVAPGHAPPTSASSATLATVRRRDTILPPRRNNRRQNLVASFSQDYQRFVSATAVPPPTLYQPSYAPAFQQTEALYFQLFRTRTASELAGYFDTVFWTQRVLQECHCEAAIRHAVVALGALYKTLEQSSQPSSSAATHESVISHWQVAVKEYSETLHASVLLGAQNQTSYRTRLMASVLLACFDSFIGDHRQAIIQVQTGLGLLEQLQADQRQYGPSSLTRHFEEELLVVFTRLAIQAKSYEMAFHFPEPYVTRLAPHLINTAESATSPPSDTSPPAPTSAAAHPSTGSFGFATVREARKAADRLVEKMLLFLELLQAPKKEPGKIDFGAWERHGHSLGAKLDAWHDAFEPLFHSRTTPGIDYLEKAGIATLKMFQLNNQVLFSTTFCRSETQFDAFSPHFRAMVDLGREVVEDDELRAAAALHCPATANNPAACPHRDSVHGGAAAFHIRPSFSADLGIVGPLFVVVTKCRDPSLRRQAIQLLRSSARREGMWDSELVAHMGQWIMEVEEEREKEGWGPQSPAPHPLGGGAETSVPEHKRVMVKSVDFDLRARFADLRVGTRGMGDGIHDNRFRETRLTW